MIFSRGFYFISNKNHVKRPNKIYVFWSPIQFSVFVSSLMQILTRWIQLQTPITTIIAIQWFSRVKSASQLKFPRRFEFNIQHKSYKSPKYLCILISNCVHCLSLAWCTYPQAGSSCKTIKLSHALVYMN